MVKNSTVYLTRLFKEFFDSEKAGGFILIGATILSLILANSYWGIDYRHFFHQKIGALSVEHWINDGLMTIFFLLIGLELEREIYQGELAKPRDALFPLSAAIGGMAIPALIYFLFNRTGDAASGIGIPMATDIAFALGILSLLGKRVPSSLKIFLTALAVIDDLGAIIIIALFYTKTLALTNLFIALGIFVVLLVLNRLKVHNLIPYLIGGVVMWYFMWQSGVHATITGVLLAFAIPFGDGSEKSASYVLQHFLHKPVAFIILPVFALTNTALLLDTPLTELMQQPHAWGIALGLFAGKPIGIMLMSWLASKAGWAPLPNELRWSNILGAGFLAGIGFTMSIFITLLAFNNEVLINQSKLAILITSFVSGLTGFLILKMTLRRS
jgi:Na+:H+ antiporter, NhaA family